jgi:hypothetical protein
MSSYLNSTFSLVLPEKIYTRERDREERARENDIEKKCKERKKEIGYEKITYYPNIYKGYDIKGCPSFSSAHLAYFNAAFIDFSLMNKNAETYSMIDKRNYLI